MNFNPENIKKLETLTTRHLRSLLKSRYEYWNDGDWIHYHEWGEKNSSWTFHQDELRHVLASRPHLPNKHERRGLLKKMKHKQKRKLVYSQRKGRLEA